MRQLEVVAGIIVERDKIYVTKRKGTDEFKDLFEFPGGKIEKDETKIEALKRELFEELEAKIEKFSFFKRIYHKYENFEVNLYLYICKVQNTEFILHVHSFGKWMSLQELKENVNLFLEADQELIKNLEEGDLII